jgi:TrmH family RNA methyltransferase
MNEITSRKNPLVVHMKKLGADSAYRREQGEFLCDGEKLFHEALDYGAEITAVLYSGRAPDGNLPDALLHKVDKSLLDAVSPLKTPQSIVFSCRIPKPSARNDRQGLTVILEGLQDPGNVGTIIRTAAAFGIRQVLLAGGCADPYNPKTVRATMGAVFRQPVAETDLDGIKALKEQGLRLYGAALGPGSRDIRELSPGDAAVAIGSEGRGLSEELLALCDGKIIIPMTPDSESLNAAVAAAIVMWEAAKERL